MSASVIANNSRKFTHIGKNLFEGEIFHLSTLDSLGEIVEISAVVPVVVNFHRLGVDGLFKGIECIGQGRKLVYNFYAFACLFSHSTCGFQSFLLQNGGLRFG